LPTLSPLTVTNLYLFTDVSTPKEFSSPILPPLSITNLYLFTDVSMPKEFSLPTLPPLSMIPEVVPLMLQWLQRIFLH